MKSSFFTLQHRDADTNGNGTLSLDELKAVCQSSGLRLSSDEFEVCARESVCVNMCACMCSEFQNSFTADTLFLQKV